MIFSLRFFYKKTMGIAFFDISQLKKEGEQLVDQMI
jgi:hypothetical protein